MGDCPYFPSNLSRTTMRIPATICLLLTIATLRLGAQTTPPPSFGATYIGTYAVRHEFEVSQGTVKKQDIMDYHVCVWLTSLGGTELTISPASITIADDGLIDDMTAGEIFDMLAGQAVRRGIALGQLAAAPNCSSPAETAVSYASCVGRTGSGSNTMFSTASPTLARHTFSYCSTSVTSTGCTGATSCGGTSEPTCTEGAGLN